MKNGPVLFPRLAMAGACVLAIWLCPSAMSETKPAADKKPDSDKKPDIIKKPPLVGTVKALADDGKSFTLLPPKTKKGEQPDPVEIQLGKGTKITTGKAPARLVVGE